MDRYLSSYHNSTDTLYNNTFYVVEEVVEDGAERAEKATPPR